MMRSTFILKTLFTVILATHLLLQTEGAFIQPTRHTLPDGLQSLNGSDQNGGCAQECEMMEGVFNVCQCSGGVQTSTALIDGVYPRGMIDTTQANWSMDFFTINRNEQSTIQISFNFADRFTLRGVELKLFNCQSLGTAVHTINVYLTVVFPSFSPPSSLPNPIGSYQTTGNDLDCNSLTTIVIPTTLPSGTFSAYFIEFTFPPGDSNTAIYLAEVRFSNETTVVPSEVLTSSIQPTSSAVQSLLRLSTVSSSTRVLTYPLSSTFSTHMSTLTPNPATTDAIAPTQSSSVELTTIATSTTMSKFTTQTVTLSSSIERTQLASTPTSVPSVTATSVSSATVTTLQTSTTEFVEDAPNCDQCSNTVYGLFGVITILLTLSLVLFIGLVVALRQVYSLKKSGFFVTKAQDYEVPVISNIGATNNTLGINNQSTQDNINLRVNKAYGEINTRRRLFTERSEIGGDYESIYDILAELAEQKQTNIDRDIVDHSQAHGNSSTHQYDDVLEPQEHRDSAPEVTIYIEPAM